MRVRKRRGWEIPEARVTPEEVFRGRRRLLGGIVAASAVVAAPGLAAAAGGLFGAAPTPEPDPSIGLYPVKRRPRYPVDRPVTEESWATSYNNFFEFSSDKRLTREAQALRLRPWRVRIDGEVEKPLTIDIDTLLARMPLEERVYRHRCVETWAMVVPWSGFPLKALVDLARPLSSAKYLRMETFLDPEVAPRQRQAWMPWPYVEGLTVAEATNDLAFIATGAYGKPLAKQNGAPLRLAVPWKYGFKSAKSIVRFSFTEERPVSFWQKLEASEYGFWANVNPDVAHPRWSQATETMLGTREDFPTRIYNGYGELVAQLYEGLGHEALFR